MPAKQKQNQHRNRKTNTTSYQEKNDPATLCEAKIATAASTDPRNQQISIRVDRQGLRPRATTAAAAIDPLSDQPIAIEPLISVECYLADWPIFCQRPLFRLLKRYLKGAYRSNWIEWIRSRARFRGRFPSVTSPRLAAWGLGGHSLCSDGQLEATWSAGNILKND